MNFEWNQTTSPNLRCERNEWLQSLHYFVGDGMMHGSWKWTRWELWVQPLKKTFEKTISTTPNSFQPSRLHCKENTKRKGFSGWIKFTFAVIYTVGIHFSSLVKVLCLLYIEDVKTIMKNHKSNMSRYLWLQHHQYLCDFSISTK